jgi:hypothetical protein
MAHHKRRRPKNRRAGCLMCKPHKVCGSKHPNLVAVERQLQVGREERRPASADNELRSAIDAYVEAVYAEVS